MQLLVLRKGNLYMLEKDFMYGVWPHVYYFYGRRRAEVYTLYKVCNKFAMYEYKAVSYSFLDREDLGL